MLPAFKTGLLYFHTLRHLKPYQVFGRIGSRLKDKLRLGKLPEVPPGLHIKPIHEQLLPAHDPWNRVDALKQGTFTFLNQTKTFGGRIDWESGEQPMLWRFNLHYFSWMHALDLETKEVYCRDWIKANPVHTPVAWHPYPISLRIINWCKAGVQGQNIIESLYLQAAYLSRHQETYLSGNHVIENVRALMLAGHLFGDQGEASKWFEQGLRLLLKETHAQILPDGVHYERSPMYHALMLEAYLDVLNVLPEHHPAASAIEKTITRMAEFLAAMVHPDGNMTLFNDATQEIAHKPVELMQRVKDIAGHEIPTKDRFEAAGYFVYRSPACYLALDGGPVGPDHLPAHAHADIFSFELSLHGEQFFVDTGVFEYQAGPMRDYVRSTRAHNTVSIDGQDQVECWSAFRVGRRSVPEAVTFASDKAGCRFSGYYKGYAELLGDNLKHQRTLNIDEEAKMLFVADRVTGKGKHLVESRLHLHPDVKVVQVEKGVFQLTKGGVTCQVTCTSDNVLMEKGWYCPEFGRRLENTVLVLQANHTLPAEIKYTIGY